MDNQLWNVFRDTGDPMGYLLYKADTEKKPNKQQKKPEQKADSPTVSA